MRKNTTNDRDGGAVDPDDGSYVLERDLEERAKPAGERWVAGVADGVAALDGAGAAGRASAAGLKGSGGRKKGQSSEGESGDAGEHCGSGEDARGMSGVD